MSNLNTSTNLTISFNEITESFVARHSYKQVIAFSDAYNFIATGPSRDTVYIQNKGEYGNFFGTKSESSITLIFNGTPEVNKNFYTYEYKFEASNLDSENIENVNFDKYIAYNEYQTTGTIQLAADTRRTNQHLRKWRTQFSRDTYSRNELKRLCNEYVYLKLTYNNNAVNSEYLQFKLYPCMYSFSKAQY